MQGAGAEAHAAPMSASVAFTSPPKTERMTPKDETRMASVHRGHSVGVKLQLSVAFDSAGPDAPRRTEHTSVPVAAPHPNAARTPTVTGSVKFVVGATTEQGAETEARDSVTVTSALPGASQASDTKTGVPGTSETGQVLSTADKLTDGVESESASADAPPVVDAALPAARTRLSVSSAGDCEGDGVGCGDGVGAGDRDPVADADADRLGDADGLDDAVRVCVAVGVLGELAVADSLGVGDAVLVAVPLGEPDALADPDGVTEGVGVAVDVAVIDEEGVWVAETSELMHRAGLARETSPVKALNVKRCVAAPELQRAMMIGAPIDVSLAAMQYALFPTEAMPLGLSSVLDASGSGEVLVGRGRQERSWPQLTTFDGSFPGKAT